MHILALISGEYGTRHVENIRARGPQDWTIESWDAPKFLPLVIDYPEDYLPESLPESMSFRPDLMRARVWNCLRLRGISLGSAHIGSHRSVP